MKTSLHRINAGILLLLFGFALVAQGVHQMEYPAVDVVDCSNDNKHLHKDSQQHDCDLCDYQVTYWVNHSPLGEPLPKLVGSFNTQLTDAPLLSTFAVVSLRGPPACS